MKIKRVEERIREETSAMNVATDKDAALVASAATGPAKTPSGSPVGADQWISDALARLGQSQRQGYGGQTPPGQPQAGEASPGGVVQG
jgi:hypothetical protein